MTWPFKAELEYFAAVATIAAAVIGICALFYAVCQLKLARRTASVTSLAALSESFRQCWVAFVATADDSKRTHAFADLLNSLEIACAAFKDDVFYGATKELLKQYLIDALLVIERDPEASERLVKALQTPTTFRNIRLFMEAHRKDIAKHRGVLAITSTVVLEP